MDHETVYLTFFGMEEHRPAAATRVINRMVACDDNRWGVDKIVNRRRWNDRETYLWVHDSLPELDRLMGAAGWLASHPAGANLHEPHAAVCSKLLTDSD